VKSVMISIAAGCFPVS